MSMEPFDTSQAAYRRLLAAAGCSEEEADKIHSLVACIQGFNPTSKSNINTAIALLQQCEGSEASSVEDTAHFSLTSTTAEAIGLTGRVRFTLFNSSDTDVIVTINGKEYRLLINAVQETLLHSVTATDEISIDAAPGSGEIAVNAELV